MLPMVSLVLVGCAQWKHPTATQADFNRDRYQCDIQAASAYPVTQTPVGTGYQTAGRVNCSTYGAQTNCTTTPGIYVPPPVTDTNAVSRAFAFDSCMQARGYTK